MHEPLSDQAGPPDVYVRGAPPPPPTQALEAVASCRGCRHRRGLHRALGRAASGRGWHRRCGAGGERDRLGRIGSRIRPGGAVSEAGTRGDPAPLRTGARPAHRRCRRRRPRPGVRADRPARHRMLGDALGPDLRRAFTRRPARPRASHALLAATRRTGRDAGRHALRRDDRLLVLSGGIARSQRRQHQSVRLCARPGPCGREGRCGDPCADARASAGAAGRTLGDRHRTSPA